MRKISYIFLFIAVFCTGSLLAQTEPAANSVEMATGLRSEGKIYVVVVVVLVILAGLLLYIISLDRKVTKLEKEIENKK
jgi:CcmD family protein